MKTALRAMMKTLKTITRDRKVKREGLEQQDAVHNEKTTFSEHLFQLRRTVIACLIAVSVAAVLCYCLYRTQLMSVAIAPLEGLGVPLVFISVSEAFVIEMKIGLIAGIIIAFPLCVFFIWRFVAPAFFPKEKRHIVTYTIVASVLFCVGVCFCYFVMLPFTLRFFVGTAPSDIEAMFTLANYTDFLGKMLIAFGCVFEAPLITYFLVRFHIVKLEVLQKLRKYILLCCFVLGAIITPPDVISQLYVAVPMYAMYEIGLLFGKISMFRESKAVLKT